MPGNNKNTKRPRRRRNYRNRPLYNRNMGYIQYHPSNSLALRKYIKMNYSFSQDIVSSTGNVVFHTIAANSLYDPDQSGVGHQPYSYDQWSALYKYYRVYGVRIRVMASIQPDGTHPQGTGYLIIACSPTSTAATTLNTAFENPCYRSWLVENDKPITRTLYYPVHKIFGIPKHTLMSDDQYRGVMGNFGTGNNPPLIARLFAGGSGVLTTSSTRISLKIQLTYYSVLSETKNLGES